jgi:hypothetical protein
MQGQPQPRIALCQRGDREAARQLLTEAWEQVGPDGDPFHRCAIAHWMADVQDDEREEIVWDLRALAAAELITSERPRQAGLTTPVRALSPSLHLNLAMFTGGWEMPGEPGSTSSAGKPT